MWRQLFGVDRAFVEHVGVDRAAAAVVVHLRPHRRTARRCGICRRRCPLYDHGHGRRRWRSLDLGTMQAFIEADAPRVQCPVHGVVVAAVPWARHNAGHTYAFDDQVAWLATHCSKAAVCELMRIAWPTVGAIIERVVDDARRRSDPFEGLRRIGIDEISHRRGQRYITVVVDHDSGRLLWAAPGRDQETVGAFFKLLGPQRCAKIELVSADAGAWIANAVAEYCPNARRCMDPFHVVSWATDALDELRRDVWNNARRSGQPAAATNLKGTRWVLWKNAQDLSASQRSTVAQIAKTNKPLYRGYLLKEQLREVFGLPHHRAMDLLKSWLSWARRSRLTPFIRVAKTITEHLPDIEAALEHHLSNARVEAINTRIRLITRIAYGFRSAEALIAMALLSLGGYCPDLPGRS